MFDRFNYGVVSPNVGYVKDKSKRLNLKQITDLLNGFEQENKELKAILHDVAIEVALSGETNCVLKVNVAPEKFELIKGIIINDLEE